ncbi:MAG: sugar phosphate isomerase/epimerase family protein [Bryobacteraceae bacterium]
MRYTRREIGKLALASVPTAHLWAAARPNSNFGGVQIGIITYSFRALPQSAEQTLQYCVDCGINAIELMSDVAERYAGAPLTAGRGFPGGAPGGGRGQLTPEQQEERKKQAAALRSWRESASMEPYRKFRQMYEDAGVKIFAFKLPPTLEMSDGEYAYIWNVAETLGADHITMELPTSDELLKRVADYAAKRKLRIAFHTHGQGGSSGFDRALAASPYTALNLDVGHYFGVTGESPVPIVEKYHARIASLHLKDRQSPQNGGRNMPWGQGDTPLKEVLQLMKRNKYTFPASIEYEYNTPEGSDVLTEIKKCVAYCRAALA